MSLNLIPGEQNQIKAGTVIFKEKEPIDCVFAVVRGNVLASNEYFKTVLSAGHFFGICDLRGMRALTDYTASDDVVLYPFKAENIGDFISQLLKNKEYKGLVVSSLAKIFKDVVKADKTYLSLSKSLYELIENVNDKYVKACRAGGVAVNELVSENFAAYTGAELNNTENFFLEFSEIPRNVMNAFYAETHLVLEKIVNDFVDEYLKVFANVSESGKYAEEALRMIYNDGEMNIVCELIKLSKELEKTGRPDKSLEPIVMQTADIYVKSEAQIAECMGAFTGARRDRMKKVLLSLNNGTEIKASQEDARAVSDEDNYRALKNSLKTILAFGNIEAGFALEFENLINEFADSRDRLSTEDEPRKLRRKISDGFFKIYRDVFFNSLNNPRLPKAVSLFLNFGFMDERLVTKEEAVLLCNLHVNSDKDYFCTLYTMPEWLRAIYEGLREPSKNEFDLEFNDAIREKLKTKEITEEQAKTLSRDQKSKVDYEIFNMFKYTERIVNGALSTFVPVLCSEQVTADFMKALVTFDRMGQTVERFRELDFSAFYREKLFADKELQIEKETVMIEVKPDIILFPCYGSNGTMWQEISCKHRDSAGRFLFPVLFDGNLDDVYIKNLGRFRWELCRTMQGTAWNNIQFKSLTSEYYDYIEYYKKNKALTDDKKEKIKNQIAKAKNNVREVFVQDYEMWIKYESQGGMKLNKQAREILALYCPFCKRIRAELQSQPAINEAIERYNRETLKKVREIELRHHAILSKNKITLPQVMTDTLKLYKEM